jgi:hypothetical protein
MKIPKSTRERAAMICQLAASNNMGQDTCARELGIPQAAPALALAGAAFDASHGTPGGSHWDDDPRMRWQHWVGQMAEAEALLRCGWSPGEGER